MSFFASHAIHLYVNSVVGIKYDEQLNNKYILIFRLPRNESTTPKIQYDNYFRAIFQIDHF